MVGKGMEGKGRGIIRMLQHWICPEYYIHECDLTKLRKMGSGPGSPFGLEDKAPWTSWMFNFGGFTDSPHPHKPRGLDTIQTTSLLSRSIWGTGRFVKMLKSGNIRSNHMQARYIYIKRKYFNGNKGFLVLVNCMTAIYIFHRKVPVCDFLEIQVWLFAFWKSSSFFLSRDPRVTSDGISGWLYTNLFW